MIFGTHLTDWTTKEPVERQAVVVKKVVRNSGWSENSYPVMMMKFEDGSEEKVDLKHWKYYYDLFPGDIITGTFQSYMMTEYKMIKRGTEGLAADEIHTEPATFIKDRRWTQPRFQNHHAGIFKMSDGRELELYVDFDWAPPAANTECELTWHGEYLDGFK